ERGDPQAVDAQPLDVVVFVDQPAQVPGAGAIGVAESPQQYLVEHGGAVPVRVLGKTRPVSGGPVRCGRVSTGSVRSGWRRGHRRSTEMMCAQRPLGCSRTNGTAPHAAAHTSSPWSA